MPQGAFGPTRRRPAAAHLVVEASKETTSLTSSPRRAPASNFGIGHTEKHTIE
ncbi:hypothetical protein [Streptomyces ossamyceticus]